MLISCLGGQCISMQVLVCTPIKTLWRAPEVFSPRRTPFEALEMLSRILDERDTSIASSNSRLQWISVNVLVYSQSCHLNIKSKHCGGPPNFFPRRAPFETLETLSRILDERGIDCCIKLQTLREVHPSQDNKLDIHLAQSEFSALSQLSLQSLHPGLDHFSRLTLILISFTMLLTVKFVHASL